VPGIQIRYPAKNQYPSIPNYEQRYRWLNFGNALEHILDIRLSTICIKTTLHFLTLQGYTSHVIIIHLEAMLRLNIGFTLLGKKRCSRVRLKVKASAQSGSRWSLQAVSPQTVSHPTGGRLPLLSARPAVIFLAAEHHRPLADTKLYCLVTDIRGNIGMNNLPKVGTHNSAES